MSFEQYDLDLELVTECFEFGLNREKGDAINSATASYATLLRLARLGAALEAKQVYHCDGCKKPFINPPFITAEKEHVDIDAREIYQWEGRYCSQECHDKDPKDTQQ